jgi:2,4-dienoyl-CoA reductase [(3E)-enoyl-CoA-producing], peroxisomal
MRDPAAVERVIAGMMSRSGRLDIVVNNAAGNSPAPLTKISPHGFKPSSTSTC